MKPWGFLTCLCILVASAAFADIYQDTISPGNLVQDPLFHDGPDIRNKPGATKHLVGWNMSIPSGSNAFSGWTISGSGLAVSMSDDGTGRCPEFLGGPGVLTQSIHTTPGQAYSFEFSWGMNSESDGSMRVHLGNVLHAYKITYEKRDEDETIPFVADSSLTRVDFNGGPGTFVFRVCLLATSGDQGTINTLRRKYQQAGDAYDPAHSFADYAPDFTFQAADGNTLSLEDYKTLFLQQQSPAGAEHITRDFDIQRTAVEKGVVHVHLWQRVSYSILEDDKRHNYQVYHMRDDTWTGSGDTWVLSHSADAGTRTMKDGQELKP